MLDSTGKVNLSVHQRISADPIRRHAEGSSQHFKRVRRSEGSDGRQLGLISSQPEIQDSALSSRKVRLQTGIGLTGISRAMIQDVQECEALNVAGWRELRNNQFENAVSIFREAGTRLEAHTRQPGFMTFYSSDEMDSRHLEQGRFEKDCLKHLASSVVGLASALKRLDKLEDAATVLYDAHDLFREFCKQPKAGVSHRLSYFSVKQTLGDLLSHGQGKYQQSLSIYSSLYEELQSQQAQLKWPTESLNRRLKQLPLRISATLRQIGTNEARDEALHLLNSLLPSRRGEKDFDLELARCLLAIGTQACLNEAEWIFKHHLNKEEMEPTSAPIAQRRIDMTCRLKYLCDLTEILNSYDTNDRYREASELLSKVIKDATAIGINEPPDRFKTVNRAKMLLAYAQERLATKESLDVAQQIYRELHDGSRISTGQSLGRVLYAQRRLSEAFDVLFQLQLSEEDSGVYLSQSQKVDLLLIKCLKKWNHPNKVELINDIVTLYANKPYHKQDIDSLCCDVDESRLRASILMARGSESDIRLSKTILSTLLALNPREEIRDVTRRKKIDMTKLDLTLCLIPGHTGQVEDLLKDLNDQYPNDPKVMHQTAFVSFIQAAGWAIKDDRTQFVDCLNRAEDVAWHLRRHSPSGPVFSLSAHIAQLGGDDERAARYWAECEQLHDDPEIHVVMPNEDPWRSLERAALAKLYPGRHSLHSPQNQ